MSELLSALIQARCASGRSPGCEVRHRSSLSRAGRLLGWRRRCALGRGSAGQAAFRSRARSRRARDPVRDGHDLHRVERVLTAPVRGRIVAPRISGSAREAGSAKRSRRAVGGVRDAPGNGRRRRLFHARPLARPTHGTSRTGDRFTATVPLRSAHLPPRSGSGPRPRATPAGFAPHRFLLPLEGLARCQVLPVGCCASSVTVHQSLAGSGTRQGGSPR
jgi:hypothetical protein